MTSSHVDSAPPFFESTKVSPFNTATLLPLSPVVKLPLSSSLSSSSSSSSLLSSSSSPSSSSSSRILGLPEWMHSQNGVLFPLERLPEVGQSLRRMKVALDFSLIVNIPVDEYERPFVISSFSSAPSSSEMRNSSQFLLIQNENPTRLSLQLRSIYNSSFDYEYWYYKLKGVMVNVGEGEEIEEVEEGGKEQKTSKQKEEEEEKRREKYDPLPLASFCPLEERHLRIIEQMTTNQRTCVRQGKTCEWTSEEEVGLKEVTQYLNSQLFSGARQSCLYFFRLSNMSPKDVKIHLMEPVTSAEQIMQRLTVSGRILGGIRTVLSEDPDDIHRNPDPGKTLQLVMLPWDSSMGSSVEFRCFVHKRRLCAISQYDPYITLPALQVPERVLLFKELIEEFHSQIASRLPYESCIMDLVLKSASSSSFSSPSFQSTGEEKKEEVKTTDHSWKGKNKEKWRVFLLEFNSFFADGNSGSSLFDWKREFSILYNGYEGRGSRGGRRGRGQSVLRYRVSDPTTSRRLMETFGDPLVRDVI